MAEAIKGLPWDTIKSAAVPSSFPSAKISSALEDALAIDNIERIKRNGAEKWTRDKWKKVPGGAFTSSFGNYLIGGEESKFTLTNEETPCTGCLYQDMSSHSLFRKGPCRASWVGGAITDNSSRFL